MNDKKDLSFTRTGTSYLPGSGLLYTALVSVLHDILQTHSHFWLLAVAALDLYLDR